MLHVEVSTMVKASRQTVLDVYADYASSPRLFPTINAVRLLGCDGPKLVLEVDHVEGRVINELEVRPPDQLDLWEEKRRYNARFRNRFESVPDGARFTVRGEIHLKGWARLLQSFLRGYMGIFRSGAACRALGSLAGTPRTKASGHGRRR